MTEVKPVLFIRADDNSFESFFTREIRSKGLEVCEPYSVPIDKIYFPSLYNKVCLRSKIPFLYRHLIANWKDRLSRYETIVIFDKALTVYLVRFIRKYAPDIRIKVWLWNVRPLEEEITSCCEVCTFDEEYAALNGYTYIPQFHFKELFDDEAPAKEGVYYIGYDKSRFEDLKKTALMFEDLGIRSKLILQKDQDAGYADVPRNIILTDTETDYADVLSDIRGYSCILELNRPEQKGLTLRSLEALFGRKKLITNNRHITSYDLYDPENIFVLGLDDKDRLSSFIKSDFRPVPPDISEKYSFESWLGRITDG